METAIVFCHCGYEGWYVSNKIKVLISSSGRAIFFFQVFLELYWVPPYHALNSEFVNFETLCIVREECKRNRQRVEAG
jgi:hypothetical protein